MQLTRFEHNCETGEVIEIALTPEEIAAVQAADAAEQAAARKSAILSRLAQLDLDSVRPLRAVASGIATEFDRNKLASIDAEAASLRTELATL